jgi:hypothetical protein
VEESTHSRVRKLLDEAGIMQDPSWASVRRTGKGVATAKLRDLAAVKDDIVVKRLGISSERGKG